MFEYQIYRSNSLRAILKIDWCVLLFRVKMAACWDEYRLGGHGDGRTTWIMLLLTLAVFFIFLGDHFKLEKTCWRPMMMEWRRRRDEKGRDYRRRRDERDENDPRGGREWIRMARGVVQLLAIEYGTVGASRDAETTTTFALCTRFLASYTQPFVFFVTPSWFLGTWQCVNQPSNGWT